MRDITNLTPEQQKDVANIIGEETKNINLLLTGVVIVMFVGFLALLFALAAILLTVWESRPSYYPVITTQISKP